jgi:hypothetical protein
VNAKVVATSGDIRKLRPVAALQIVLATRVTDLAPLCGFRYNEIPATAYPILLDARLY